MQGYHTDSVGERVASVASRVRGFFQLSLATLEFGFNGMGIPEAARVASNDLRPLE